MKKKLICILLLCSMISTTVLAGCNTNVEVKANRPDALTDTNSTVEVSDVVIESNDFSVKIGVSNGIELLSIYDKEIDHEYILTPSRLFKFTSDDTTYSSQNDLKVLGVKEVNDGFAIRAICEKLKTIFDVIVKPDPDAPAVQIEFYISNDSESAKYLSITYPEILPVQLPGDEADARVCIPQEGGWVSQYNEKSTLGFSPDVVSAPTKNAEDASGGLPTCVNAMEVISAYNANGAGGIFIADTNGKHGADIEPVHMLVKYKMLQGYSVAQLKAGEYCQLATIAIGAIRNGDWHQAVDYYNEKRADITTYPETPAWLRDAGAIYSANNGGAGGNYLLLAETASIYHRLGQSFNNLPSLVTNAKKMGTNVILLVDWYDRAKLTSEDKVASNKIGAVTSTYYNKGDYYPREDMGGAEAFKAGVQALHEAGGKLIVYVEPYVVLKFSEIGREKGERWAARNPQGELDGTYGADYSYSMSCAVPEWREYLVGVCVRLVEEYGVDGIYFDSMGNQWNHSYYTNALGKTSTIKEYNEGFVAMCKETREAIQKVNPEAVVLAEAGASTAEFTDGGLSGDFLWGKTVSDPRIMASPVRYGMPEANLFITGETLSQLKQCYAAGYNLAVSYYWEQHQGYIRDLVMLRQKYKDAMIDGKQEFQPETQNDSVAAYLYAGNENTVVTALNLSGSRYEGTLQLGVQYANTTWVNELTSQSYAADAQGVLNVAMEQEELMVLGQIK